MGIISSIALVSINKIIENSHKEAHVSNARSMIRAAHYYMLSDPRELSKSGSIVNAYARLVLDNPEPYSGNYGKQHGRLVGDGYLDKYPIVPGSDKFEYHPHWSDVWITRDDNGILQYEVRLAIRKKGDTSSSAHRFVLCHTKAYNLNKDDIILDHSKGKTLAQCGDNVK